MSTINPKMDVMVKCTVFVGPHNLKDDPSELHPFSLVARFDVKHCVDTLEHQGFAPNMIARDIIERYEVKELLVKSLGENIGRFIRIERGDM